jgi:hypothetical protein
VLNRQGLGTAQRSALEESAERARVVGLAGLAQLAIGTGDLVLAAVVVNENDRRRDPPSRRDPRGLRPVHPAHRTTRPVGWVELSETYRLRRLRWVSRCSTHSTPPSW